MKPTSYRLVCCVPACVVGSGDGQLRSDVVGDDGVDDVAVDPAVGPEVDAHPVGRRGSSRHSRFDTDADKPGMVIEAALGAAESQQIGILDKRLLQPLAEAVSIEAGLPCLDNDIEVDRPRPGRSNCGGRSRPQVCRRFSAISALPWRPHRCPRSHGQWRMTFSVTLLRQRSAERM